MDIQLLTIASALKQLRAGLISAEDIYSACLMQVEKLNPQLHVFISPPVPNLPPHFAGKDQPLYGIPIALKDIYQTANILTTCGTPFFGSFIPDQDAVVVERLKAAGAVMTGKTNTHEIALGVTGVNPHYGAVCNPWDVRRISGGSSSGSAVAVSAGMCLAAMGSDTGGSIRIPASLSGVVGLKPTFGRISMRGIFPLSWNLDHAGPVTKNIRDAALILQVLAGYDEQDPASVHVPVDDYCTDIEAGVRGWRVAVLTGDYAWESDPEVLDVVRLAGEVFSALGAQVKPVELNFLREAAQANSQMTQADAAAFHRERFLSHPTWFGEDVRQRLQTGALLTSSEYALARRLQAEMRRRMEIFFRDYDVLLLPTTPITAPLMEGADALEQARRLTRFTAPFNLTGLPALSMPCGFSAEGLPVGLQIVCPAWAEKRLLQAAHAYEQATQWTMKPPVL